MDGPADDSSAIVADVRDQVDDILDQWRARRPDLDVEPAAIVLRIDRVDRHLQAEVEATLQKLGLTRWRFAVLSALRRADPQRGLRPGDLLRDTLSTTGAMTNRLDRLEEDGLVERVADPTDRRAVLVRLTDAGRALVDRAVVIHLENEARLVAHLDAREREQLAGLLRRLLARYEPAGDPPG
jgi:DNA-binding MarR family transcriptional regulator